MIERVDIGEWGQPPCSPPSRECLDNQGQDDASPSISYVELVDEGANLDKRFHNATA
jgi:hypothetical protein